MEVVVAASLLAHIGVLTIERRARGIGTHVHRPADTIHSRAGLLNQREPEVQPQTQYQSSPQPQNAAEVTEQNHHAHSRPEQVDEDSLQFLQQRLDELRDQARRLNAPDTLVQYAHVTREANKVEKALNEKRAEQGVSATTPMGVDAIAKSLADVLKPGADVLRKGVAFHMLKMVPRMLAFIFLWYYFTLRKSSARQGIAMMVDCQALRPLSFLFRKVSPACSHDDWVCVAQASQTPVCAISYSWALVLCSIVIPLLFHA
eukprot:TRINITY_DN909_c0_g1_i2.p1 TRINITY_DN909_c0_g1~~TRINITY_DN909_c0_g1_i2.p1  ORF type:complete len:260 (+),score=32.63 TRINITY_DN909_c0_g1_i2:1064-1843(+)